MIVAFGPAELGRAVPVCSRPGSASVSATDAALLVRLNSGTAPNGFTVRKSRADAAGALMGIDKLVLSPGRSEGRAPLAMWGPVGLFSVTMKSVPAEGAP